MENFLGEKRWRLVEMTWLWARSVKKRAAHRPGGKEVHGAHGDKDTWSLLSDWNIESKEGSGKR